MSSRLQDKEICQIAEHVRNFNQFKKLYKRLFHGDFRVENKRAWKSVKDGLKWECREKGVTNACLDELLKWRNRAHDTAKEDLKTILTEMGRTDILTYCSHVFQNEN